MRVLLSTIGSRGDVQPVVALALKLRELGQEVRIVAPPDFGEWIGSLGIPFTPVGPELRQRARPDPGKPLVPPTPEQRKQLMAGTVRDQFAAVGEAAKGCDVIVAWSALQIAAASVAEHLGIRYVYVTFCPNTLPSPHHGPAPLGSLGQKPPEDPAQFAELWARNAEFLNAGWGEALNTHRAELGLAPVTDVRSYMFTEQPWLAADPTLAPWQLPAELDVVQTGAWSMPDERPLPPEVTEFLDAGEPPVFFGFGSMPAPGDLGQEVLKAARAVGRRAIVSRGWADVELIEDAPDCLSVGEVNYDALFPRVAAVVHHGGSGTSTAVTRSGTPQVIVPQLYDQHYLAERVRALGIGFAHAPGAPTAESLVRALEFVLRPEIAERAAQVAQQVRTDGTLVAARLLLAGVQHPRP
ncbi:glycosyltransferase [Crossiella sp. CA198]|uniref:glycosyltransferase n=1 Tax=Crossiella sp. CA198 TaxID=3455607 RepID=UPI003F8D4667